MIEAESSFGHPFAPFVKPELRQAVLGAPLLSALLLLLLLLLLLFATRGRKGCRVDRAARDHALDGGAGLEKGCERWLNWVSKVCREVAAGRDALQEEERDEQVVHRSEAACLEALAVEELGRQPNGENGLFECVPVERFLVVESRRPPNSQLLLCQLRNTLRKMPSSTVPFLRSSSFVHGLPLTLAHHASSWILPTGVPSSILPSRRSEPIR